MNDTFTLYCIFCYLFAIGNLTVNTNITFGSIFAALIAPIAMPIILGQKLK